MATKITKQQMKTVGKPLIAVAALLALIAWSGGACDRKVKPGRIEVTEGIFIPADAAAFEVKVEDLPGSVEAAGTVTSKDKIRISAKIGAHVMETPVSAGDKVKKGQVLIVLDDREIRQQLAAAEAQLKQAQSEYERTKKLVEVKAATEQAFIAAESQFNASKAQAERAGIMLGYARIESPIDGVVADRRIDAGALASPGQELMTVYDPDNMRFEAPVPVRLIDRLSIDQKVEVKIARPDRTLVGKVCQIVSEVDPASRTQTVKADLEGDVKGVLPGAFGRMKIEEATRPGILVPSSAVYRVGQLEMVQVVREKRAIRRTVQTGARTGDKVEILSGLSAGEVILVKPLTEG